uniref:Uncharacterized protein n=1 Tax=viral metagenome TaxID=1070528 RepID=A0A6C0IY77_9ZZZZ
MNILYNKIINPSTNRKVNIYTKLGQKILNNYIYMIGGSHIPEPSFKRVSLDMSTIIFRGDKKYGHTIANGRKPKFFSLLPESAIEYVGGDKKFAHQYRLKKPGYLISLNRNILNNKHNFMVFLNAKAHGNPELKFLQRSLRVFFGLETDIRNIYQSLKTLEESIDSSPFLDTILRDFGATKEKLKEDLLKIKIAIENSHGNLVPSRLSFRNWDKVIMRLFKDNTGTLGLSDCLGIDYNKNAAELTYKVGKLPLSSQFKGTDVPSECCIFEPNSSLTYYGTME